MNSIDTALATARPARPVPMGCLPEGTLIQDYRIGDVLGEGGFAFVYRAADVMLEREIAVKEYMPSAIALRTHDYLVQARSAAQQDTFDKGMRSFINEARMLAKFKHPALVEVLRFWEENGTAYMAMPYYHGRTLREVLRDDRSERGEAWLRGLLDPLLGGLRLMHETQCFHRDISTDNIIVLDDGNPVLLDFGAARRIVAEPDQVATVILKPGFAPVEQYSDDNEAAPQGPWTDIYALCAVCYCAIARKMPTASVARIMRDPLVPLVELAPAGYSRGFLAAIDGGLAVRPENRPQSIEAFCRLLGAGAEAVSAGQRRVESPVAGVRPSAPPAGTVREAPDRARTMLPAAPPRPSADSAPRIVPPVAACPEVVPVATGNDSPTTALPGRATVPWRGRAAAMAMAAVALVTAAYSLLPSGKPVPASDGPVASVARDGAAGVAPVPGSAADEDSRRAASRDSPARASSATANVTEVVSPRIVTVLAPAAAAVPAPAPEAGAPGQGQGLLVISAKPWGRVTVDGKAAGIAPPARRLTLTAGRHEVLIEQQAGKPKRFEILVEDKGRIDVAHDFAADQGGTTNAADAVQPAPIAGETAAAPAVSDIAAN